MEGPEIPVEEGKGGGWAYYQAKVIGEHLYRVQAEQVDLALAERGAAMRPEARQQAEARLKRYREEAERRP